MTRQIRQTRLAALISAIGGVLAVFAIADGVHAGFITRLMDPFDIGDARSLPWGTDPTSGIPGYDTARLVRDTDALLTPSTPIIVRLETLRRAVLYASGDRAVAKALLVAVTGRAHVTARSSTPDARAVLDAAFVTDLFWQIGEHSNPPFSRQSRIVRGLIEQPGGYALIQRALGSIPKDAEFMFGVALIAGVNHLGEATFANAARAARAGAPGDTLLARNLGRIYADRITDLEKTARERNAAAEHR